MTQENIKGLEKELWDSADDLRANSKLTAAEYKDPLLGLVLLRFAQNRYEDAKSFIEKKLPINPRTGKKREATKDDYTAAGAILLPEKAKYDYLAQLPESEVISDAINQAMKLIEAEYKDLEGILPKNYQEFDDKLLRDLVRVFNSDAVKNAKGDVFGRIYEFFLMKFSMQGAGAQEGGEFFTPPSLVNLIVDFIQPDHGIVHDPACGSGGMFVQTAQFIQNHEHKNVNEAVRVYGTELKSNNVKLAKMNLAIHGIDGKVSENNSFYTNPHNLTGKCDFVMANPPFNVDKVDGKNKFLTEDKRLPFGVPLTGKGTISNGNYLWMQYFYSYLNPTGRAGFVMASSATDAGNAEKLIRQQLVESEAVECVVSIGNNFFYTRSLPCHVWFYNKGKLPENKNKILMLDTRNVYRVVNSTLNDFSPGQLTNLTTINELFRKNKGAFKQALAFHKKRSQELIAEIQKEFQASLKGLKTTLETEKWSEIKLDNEPTVPELTAENLTEVLASFQNGFAGLQLTLVDLAKEQGQVEEKAKKAKKKKTEITKLLAPYKSKANKLGKPLKKYNAAIAEWVKDTKQSALDWQALLEYFPEGKYRDVEGLCKIVDLEDIKEQDYSLTPGRYVGVKVDIDMNFDYKGRMAEIHQELEVLNKEANDLMAQIQGVEL